MINKEFKNEYKVKWISDAFTPHNTESLFNYNNSDSLTMTFKMICNIIINYIARNGNLAVVEKMLIEDNGVIIIERLPNGENINLHCIWIEKAN